MKNRVAFCIIITALAVGCFFNYSQNKEINLNKVLKGLTDQSKIFVAVAAKTTPAVVNISIVRETEISTVDPFHDFYGDEFFRRFFQDEFPRRYRKPERRRKRKYRQRGMGSGVIIDKRGYILTNTHVVKNADEVTVKLGDNREFKAKVVGTDEKTDVAVLKINAKDLPVAPLGNSDKVAVGQWVLAIGNPFGLSQTVTSGIISAKGRANVGIADYEDFIQTDAAINPGNSGGPLVNLRGEVIGINTAIISRSGGYQGIGFAIPINMARNVMRQIIDKGTVKRGWLGVRIQELSSDLAKSFGLSQAKGALIAEIVKKSPAEKAGLRQGDIILKYNGIEIKNIAHLRNSVATTEIGKRTPIVIFREGKKMTRYVTIGDLNQSRNQIEAKGSKNLDKLGIELQYITTDQAKKYGYEKEGVIISSVKQGSLGEEYGLRKNDLIIKINRHKILSLQDVSKALSESKERLLLLVRSGDAFRYLVIPLK